MIQSTKVLLAALLTLGAPQMAVAKAAPAAAKVTPEMIRQYYELFDRHDPHFADLLADDVVFPHISGKTFRSKAEVVGFYQNLVKTGLGERREPVTIVVDNEHGLAAVELKLHFWAAQPGVEAKLPNGDTIKPGEEWVGHSVMFYTLKNGKIAAIRGSQAGPGKLSVEKR